MITFRKIVKGGYGLMESNNTLGAERRFSKRENRIQKINTTALIVVTIIEALLILALTVQTFITPTAYGKLGLVPLLFLCVGCILDWVFFVKDKSSEKIKYIMMIVFLIGWGYLMLTGVNIFVTFYIFPIYIITILYYDRKFEKISFISILATTILRAVSCQMPADRFLRTPRKPPNAVCRIRPKLWRQAICLTM